MERVLDWFAIVRAAVALVVWLTQVGELSTNIMAMTLRFSYNDKQHLYFSGTTAELRQPIDTNKRSLHSEQRLATVASFEIPVAGERPQRKELRISVIAEIEHPREAGRGVERLVPEAVFALSWPPGRRRRGRRPDDRPPPPPSARAAPRPSAKPCSARARSPCSRACSCRRPPPSRRQHSGSRRASRRRGASARIAGPGPRWRGRRAPTMSHRCSSSPSGRTSSRPSPDR